ncbi:MAG: family 16 glycoside hydrolase, partial [Planctomycetota bacterium]
MKCKTVIISLLACGCLAAATRSWDFDKVPEGSLPAGWKAEATGQDKATADWQVKRDEKAPLGPGVLCLTATNHTQRGAFNICWTRQVLFFEGEIAVFLKGNAGRIDQGGGPIWRVQDRNNYYIARYNPLEENVSIYYVKDGRRVMLGYTGKLELTDAWHVLKISHRGDRIRAYLDGDMKLMVNSGQHITKEGGVG